MLLLYNKNKKYSRFYKIRIFNQILQIDNKPFRYINFRRNYRKNYSVIMLKMKALFKTQILKVWSTNK